MCCWLEWTSNLPEEALCSSQLPPPFEGFSFLTSIVHSVATASRCLCFSWKWWRSVKVRMEGMPGKVFRATSSSYLTPPPLHRSFPGCGLPSEMAFSIATSPISSLLSREAYVRWVLKIFILKFWNKIVLKIPGNQILANNFCNAAVISGLKKGGWR